MEPKIYNHSLLLVPIQSFNMYKGKGKVVPVLN
jgi:hypothetical protein